MKTFGEIHEMALARKGADGLAAEMPSPPETPLRDLTDDRLLAEFTKRIFQAGFNWSVIEKKWPGFEAAFHGFDIARNAMMSDEYLFQDTIGQEQS